MFKGRFKALSTDVTLSVKTGLSRKVAPTSIDGLITT